MNGLRRHWPVLLAAVLAGGWLLAAAAPAIAQDAPVPLPTVQLGVGRSDQPQDVVASLQILLLLTVLSLAPALLVLVTAFTRIIIVLSFVRSALGTQNMPPNQVLVALGLFLTFFVMQPTWNAVNTAALQPYLRGDLNQAQAIAAAEKPVKEFMKPFIRKADLALFMNAARLPQPNDFNDVPFWVAVPAFAISELKTAFLMGFYIFLPFLVIDLVVTTTLLSMGMLFLPPMLISLPFKILLFIMVDGWHLIVERLLTSFRVAG